MPRIEGVQDVIQAIGGLDGESCDAFAGGPETVVIRCELNLIVSCGATGTIAEAW
jgi:hypothetical protein